MTISEAIGYAARQTSAVGRGGRGWSVFALAVAALVSIPVVVVLSAVAAPTAEIWAHLLDTVFFDYVANTVWLMLGVGLATVVGGVGTAWLVTMCRFPGRGVFEWALLVPLAMPAYVIAYTYAGLLEFAGPLQSLLRELMDWTRHDYWFPEVRSLGGAIVMMSAVLYPYVYLLARAAFLEQSVCVLEVSRVLGRTPWRCFREVALPLARPAIVGGTALALMEALGDYGTVQYFGVDTFTTGIFRIWFGLGSPDAAMQLAAVLLLFILIVLVLERVSRGQARYHHTSSRYRALPRFELQGGHAALAFLFCLAPIAVGFLIPGAQLLVWALESAPATLDARFARLAWHSLALAAGAALVAVVVAVLLAYGLRLAPTRFNRIVTRLASMGYAVPGIVIAIGVIIPFAWFDNRVDGFLRQSFGVSSGLLLSGTVAALLFAYLVRFLAISFNAVEAGLGKITESMDGAARTLGRSAGGTLIKVHAPLMWSSLLTAGLLVFVDVMKELPATLVMRPFDFNTLAVRAFELASDERLADSAPAALAIVAVGILPVILLSRAIARGRPGGDAEAL